MLPKGLLKEYAGTFSLMLRIMDMVTVFMAGWISYFIRFNDVFLPPSYQSAFFIAFLVTPIIFYFFHIYASVRGAGFIQHIMTLFQAVCVLAFALASMAFFTKSGDMFSRTWFVLWMLTTLALLILTRCSLLCFLHFMRSHGWNERRVVIFGAGVLGTKFANTVQQALWTGFRILTFIDDDAANKEKFIQKIPVIQTPDDLATYLKNHNIDEIWLALPLRAEARVKAILHQLRHQTVTTRFVLDIFGLDLLNHSISDVAGFPVLNIRGTPMMGVNRVIKAMEDRMIAAFILLLISPLLCLIAFLIKLTSKGPVFFKQHRLGWDGKIIKVYKFRTMIVHQEQTDHITQATINDTRITPLGKFLRRTSLDELPQFINVLQGRMSIVGPRPHALAHNELYKDSIYTYMQRHRVKPGITGWAQINGWRGETDTLNKMEKRVEYDLFYINNWSLWFDLKIILLTLLKGFINRNAY